MADLSSCYFCSRALDVSLEEYPIAPDATDPDEQLTVTLCPTCRAKLDRVLDPVVNALRESDRSTDGPLANGSSDSDDLDPLADPVDDLEDSSVGDDPTSSVDPDETADEIEVPGPEVREDIDTETGGTAEDSTDDVGRDEGSAGEADERATGKADERSAGETDERSAGETDERSAGETDERSAGEAARGSTGEADDGRGDDRFRIDGHPEELSGGNGSPSGGAEGGEKGSADDTSERADPESDSAGSDDATPSVDTYNKVVRLLQNREFPVDRAEFETIAAGAYQLETDEVAAVLDLAVEKGLLQEEGGLLKRPE